MIAQSRQKLYADVRRKSLDFDVVDHVFLKVKPRHGIVRFSNKGKLAPRYIRPYRITQRVGTVSYHLDLPPQDPPQLERIHNVFHISKLHRHIPDPSHVLPIDKIEVHESIGTYETYPVAVVDRKEHVLRNWVIPLLKLIWCHHGSKEATWELKLKIQHKHSHPIS